MRIGRVLTFLAVLIGGYSLILGGVYVFQRNLIYFPDRTAPDLTNSGLAGVAEATYTTADGVPLLSWYRQPDPGMPTVLYFHGNAGHIGSRIDKIRPFVAAGYGVLLAGYRGYGGNGGSPGEQGLYADARAAVEFLNARGTAAKDLVLYGESLGSAVATRMAAELSGQAGGVLALVLEAPFTSVVEAAASFYPIFPVRWVLHDRFDSGSIIGRVETPVFILHGENDTTMPIRFGKKLYDRAAQPKESLWIAGAGHNDLFEHGGGAAVLDFIARHR